MTIELTFQNFKTTVELTRDFLFVTVHRAPQQEELRLVGALK